MRTNHVILAAILLLLSSCTISHSSGSSTVDRSKEIETAISTEPAKAAWRVYAGQNAKPRLERVYNTSTTVAKIGVQVATVTREVANKANVQPFRGAVVKRSVTGKPAYLAGVRKGDIILKVDGEDVANSEQLRELIISHGKPGVPLPITIFVGEESDADATSQRTLTEQTLMITPYAEEQRDEEKETIELEYSAGIQAFTGMQVAAIAPDVSLRVYGVNEPQILVTGIVTGSEAYKAGIRPSDRITKIDGQPIDTLEAVQDGVRLRALAIKDTPSLYDLTKNLNDAPNSEAIANDLLVEVDGPLGIYKASIPITQATSKSSHFGIPIVFGYDETVQATNVGFLNCILQFGFNYRSRMHPSTTREPVETSTLSVLSLGMFQAHHGLRGSEYRLFWFIRFGSAK